MPPNSQFSLQTNLNLNSQQFNAGVQAAQQQMSNLANTAQRSNSRISNSYQSLTGIVGKLSAGFIAVYGALEAGKAVIASSEALSDSYEKTITGLNFGLDVFQNSIANMDFSNFFTNIIQAIDLGRQYAEFLDSQEDKKRGITIQEKQNTLEITKLRNELNNVNLSEKRRLEIAEKIKVLQNETGKDQIQWAEDNLTMMTKTIAATKKVSEAEIIRFINYKKQDSEIFDKAEEYNDLLSEQSALKKTILYAGGNNVVKESKRLQEVSSQLRTYNQTIKDAALIQKKLSGEEIENITNATVAWYDAQINLQEQLNKTDKKQDSFEKKLAGSSEVTKEATYDMVAYSKSLKDAKDLRQQLQNTIGGDIEKKYAKPASLNIAALPDAKQNSKGFYGTFADDTNRYTDALLEAANANLNYSNSFILLQDRIGSFGAGTVEAFGAAMGAMSRGGESFKEVAKNGANAAKQMISQNLAIAASQAIMAVKGIPFPANIIAAGISMAGIMAIGNSIKFAEGGIVPGSSFYGDKVPAMVNSGEMILNTNQQANLFKQLNGSGTSLGGEVRFEIEGSKLVGILNNHNRQQNKFR